MIMIQYMKGGHESEIYTYEDLTEAVESLVGNSKKRDLVGSIDYANIYSMELNPRHPEISFLGIYIFRE